MRILLTCWLAALAAMITTSVDAQTCGGTYRVQAGDTLTLIAEKMYQNPGLWPAIHDDNLDLIGENPGSLRVDMALQLRCIDGQPTGLAAGDDPTGADVGSANAASLGRKINVLTGSDYPPFTDKNLPNGGLLVEVVQAAMEAASPDRGFEIHWVDDWPSHIDPLLSNAMLDIGFPWSRPDCSADPETYRCANLVYSDMMFEMLTLLYVDNTRPLAFNSNADLKGKTLCRPKGYSTFIFDHMGRNWLASGHVTLEIALSPDECFDLLTEGTVDAVVLNEFLGRQKLRELGLQNQIGVAQGQPISVDGLYAVVHKSHPQASELLTIFDDGLRHIRKNGRYQSIVDDHLSRIWAEALN